MLTEAVIMADNQQLQREAVGSNDAALC